MYVARLMLFPFLGENLPGISDLTNFDGHYVDEHKGLFSLSIPDEAWDLRDAIDWTEDWEQEL